MRPKSRQRQNLQPPLPTSWLVHRNSSLLFGFSARSLPCLTDEDTPFFFLCLQLFHTPLLRGEESAALACLHDSGGGKQINTSFIERFNATMRERLAALTRRCRHASQRLEAVQWGMYLIGCTYNLCWLHQQLGRTPAMAAGLTDHAWSVKEVLCYKVAPAPFAPCKRPRGRPPTQPQVDGSAVKAPRGRSSKYLSILRRLQEEKRAALLQGARSTTS